MFGRATIRLGIGPHSSWNKIESVGLRKCPYYRYLIMVALCNRETIYIFMLWFVLLLSFFFPRLISAAEDWMFTILWHIVWP